MNYLWILLMLSGYIYSFFNGTIEIVTESLLLSSMTAVEICISLLGTMCFWSGLLKVAQKAMLVERFSGLFSRVLVKVFPEISDNHEAKAAIVMNLTANMLGLGNTATPLGIRAMEELQKRNPNKKTITNDMIMFIILNTAMLQLMPTTVLALRASFKSADAAAIIPLVWISSLLEMCLAIPTVRIAIKISNSFSNRNRRCREVDCH